MSDEPDSSAHNSSRTVRRFPFSAVVGQDDAKLALLLAAVDPLIGGVLLRGHKGSAKTTLARGLAGLVGGFTDLPLGTTEDRLLGSLDVGAALAGGTMTFRPGLLAAADGGVLYVDEVNLLADHLVDVLLDVAVSGEQIVERDGISHRHPARFVLVGSMNPEEGELRPQLVDRFGLCVEVRATDDVAERMQAVRRRLAHDTLAGGASFAAAQGRAVDTPTAGAAGMSSAEVDVAGGHVAVRGAVAGDAAFATADAELAEQLRRARPAAIDDDVLEAASRLALAVGAEGLRADLTLCRAAAVCAGLDGRDVTTLDDLRRAAPLVLAHRARRRPHDPPVIPPEQLADAIDETLGDVLGQSPVPPPGDPAIAGDEKLSSDGDQNDGETSQTPPGDPVAAGGRQSGSGGGDDGDGESSLPLAGDPAGAGGRRSRSGGERNAAGPGRPLPVDGSARRPVLPPPPATIGDRGRFVRAVPAGEGAPVAALSTVRALATRRVGDPSAIAEPGDLRRDVRVTRRTRLIVVAVDLSGSMGAPRRAAAATDTVLGLLDDAYQRRHRVALVTFRGDGAEVALAPTTSIDVARNRLHDLATGGATPLAAGLRGALGLLDAHGDDHPLLVVLTDGRATGGADALDDALTVAATIRRRGVDSVVVDCEDGPVRLGLAASLATALGATLIPFDDHLAATVAERGQR